MPDNQVTEILHEFGAGDQEALKRLIPLVYAELHKLADAYLRRERPEHTLQPTALVNEAYLRLAAQAQPDYRSRTHFYGVAAQVMRQILVDHARSRKAAKRGGGQAHISLDSALIYTGERAAAMVALDDALNALAAENERRARLVELRYFGGLSVEECAGLFDMQSQQVYRELRIAQAWLHRELSGDVPAQS
jgi:RNA polymerase sigma factor (TIGR02999 family)